MTNTDNMTIEQLRAKVAQLERAKQGKLMMKVSEKGAASLYGLGRFPVTLYKSQWTSLLSYVDSIKAFLEDHDSELATKE